MAISVPAGVTAGQIITEAWGDSVAAAIEYLAKKPACRVYHDTTQSLADAATTSLVFNSERFDPTAMHSTSSNTGRITFNDAGVYVVSFHGAITAAADYAAIVAYLRLNGATYIARQSMVQNSGSGLEPYISISTIYKFAAGDYVEVQIHQDNTAAAARNLLASPNYSPEFAATWVGLGT